MARLDAEKVDERGFMIKIKKKSNPTDHELLSNIIVKKEQLGFHSIDKNIRYRFYLKNKEIARADVEIYNNVIGDILMDPKYQRKGLGTFIYNYIESDLDIKLKPSEYLSSKGEAFWKNRSRKQLLSVLKTRVNPTDKEFLSKIKISKTKIGISIIYKAFLNNNIIATAEYVPNDNSVSSLWVNTPYRRKGLASFMYNTIEKDQKVSLQPSQDLLPDGRRFWENRLKSKPEKLGLLYR